MRTINSFKQVWLAILIFLLPIASYLHLFFINYSIDSFLDTINVVLKFKTIENLIYFTLYGISYSLLYFIWAKLIETRYKWLVLFYIVPNAMLLNGQVRWGSITNFNFFLFFLFSFILVYLFSYTNFKSCISKSEPLKVLSKSLTFPILFFLSILISFTGLLYPMNTDSLTILFFNLDANGFPDARTNLFMISFKFSWLCGILMWFFTEKRWYRYSLLSSIILLTNQLYNLLWTKTDNLDEFELNQSGPFLLVVLLGLILLANATKTQEKVNLFLRNTYIKIEHLIFRKVPRKRRLYFNKKG